MDRPTNQGVEVFGTGEEECTVERRGLSVDDDYYACDGDGHLVVGIIAITLIVWF